MQEGCFFFDYSFATLVIFLRTNFHMLGYINCEYRSVTICKLSSEIQCFDEFKLASKVIAILERRYRQEMVMNRFSCTLMFILHLLLS